MIMTVQIQLILTLLTLGDPSDADGDTDGEIWCQDSHTLSLLLQDDQTA